MGGDKSLKRVGSRGGASIHVAQNRDLMLKSLTLFPTFPKAEEAKDEAEGNFDRNQFDDQFLQAKVAFSDPGVMPPDESFEVEVRFGEEAQFFFRTGQFVEAGVFGFKETQVRPVFELVI